MTTMYRTLLTELAEIERRQTDETLTSDERERLEHIWKATLDRLDELEGRPSTPVPSSPVLMAPPPPPGAPRKPISTTLRTGISRSGKLMTQLPDGRWVPAPPLPAPAPASPPHRSLTITIPEGMASTEAPPPPGARVCNCDGDGECTYCEEERWVDTRKGCAHCQGCMYCQEETYDGDEA